MKNFIWIAVIGAVFGLLWYQGLIGRLNVYIGETKEELRKCNWPTIEELKGSTALVFVGVLLLGGFTVGVDVLFFYFVNRLTSI
ncbi:MAG: SecE/Sec61-gamma subunit of protein translocation complex [Verrucomicrobiota bacterium]|jgi:preprotein translocase subunit SecE